MLQANAVSKSFFSNKVLDSVDFDVQRGRSACSCRRERSR